MSMIDDSDVQAKSTRLRILVVGFFVPLGISLTAVVLMISWLPSLPDPIAVHWTVGPEPDGFGPAWPFALAPIVIMVLYCMILGIGTYRLTPAGGITANQKFLVVTSVWLSVMLSVTFAGSVAGQRGLTDPHEAPNIGPWLVFGIGTGLVLASAAWFLLPAAEKPEDEGEAAQPLMVDGEERVSWSKSDRLGNGGLLVLGFALTIGTVAVVLAAVSSSGFPWFAIAILVGVVLLSATNFWWRISADRRGFTTRGVLGWPYKRIPLSDIRKVTVIEVNPTRDFGGWGWRGAAGGRSGIILRAGKAIEVTRQDGKRFAVTVDDASTGARVLAALVAQSVKK